MGISKREVIIAQLTAVLSYCGCPIDIRLEETSTYYYSCDADGGSALALADAGKPAGEPLLPSILNTMARRNNFGRLQPTDYEPTDYGLKLIHHAPTLVRCTDVPSSNIQESLAFRVMLYHSLKL